MARKATITVEQIRSATRRPAKQRQTLKGLGLDKLHRIATLEDTPSIRGMINKVGHLVRVVDRAPTSPASTVPVGRPYLVDPPKSVYTDYPRPVHGRTTATTQGVREQEVRSVEELDVAMKADAELSLAIKGRAIDGKLFDFLDKALIKGKKDTETQRLIYSIFKNRAIIEHRAITMLTAPGTKNELIISSLARLAALCGEKSDGEYLKSVEDRLQLKYIVRAKLETQKRDVIADIRYFDRLYVNASSAHYYTLRGPSKSDEIYASIASTSINNTLNQSGRLTLGDLPGMRGEIALRIPEKFGGSLEARIYNNDDLIESTRIKVPYEKPI